MFSKRIIFTAIMMIAGMGIVIAQCDDTADSCSIELEPFMSDGSSYYFAQISADETVSLEKVFFSGMIYRIVACTNPESNAEVKFTIYDGNGNKIFSNEYYNYTYSWDFEIGATDEYRIEATLTEGFGCCILQIGYDPDYSDYTDMVLMEEETDDIELDEDIEDDF